MTSILSCITGFGDLERPMKSFLSGPAVTGSFSPKAALAVMVF